MVYFKLIVIGHIVNMNNKTKLSTAIASVIGGLTLAVGGVSSASASTTMYNLYDNNGATPCAPCNAYGYPNPIFNADGGQTDGWVWGGPTPANAYQGGISNGNPNAATPGWVGTSGATTTPFNYVGAVSLNWGIQLTSATDSGQISNADSLSRYGVSANIDTAKGAWYDNGSPTGQGWLHDLDIGLFKSTVTTEVHLDIHGVNLSGTNYGFTIFQGMTSNNTGYVHHGAWNQKGDGSMLPGNIGFDASQIVATTDISGTTPVNLNQIQFTAQAGQIYTIMLGGVRDGTWYDTTDGYVLNVAAVPVPGAIWLFGSALAGLIGFNRKKSV